MTAPVIFALASGSEGAKELLSLIDAEFVEEGSLTRALELVSLTGGLATAQKV